jgi:hypothetical protein
MINLLINGFAANDFNDKNASVYDDFNSSYISNGLLKNEDAFLKLCLEQFSCIDFRMQN